MASAFVSKIETAAPSSIRARTISAPIPPAPPVTSATFPVKLFFILAISLPRAQGYPSKREDSLYRRWTWRSLLWAIDEEAEPVSSNNSRRT